MIAQKYHVIISASILAMLLLLGLHLLGVGIGSLSGSQLANSTSQPSQLVAGQPGLASTLSESYRHPIPYEKASTTMPTNVNGVDQIDHQMGSQSKQNLQLNGQQHLNNHLPQVNLFPLGHYQQQQQQQEPQPQMGQLNPFGQPQEADFFPQMHPNRHLQHPQQQQPQQQFRPPIDPQLHILGFGLPPPPPPPLQPTTTLPPRLVQNPSLPGDSVTSASNELNSTKPGNPQNQHNNVIAPGPSIYYTPPIFSYNQPPPDRFNGGQLLGDSEAQLMSQFGHPQPPSELLADDFSQQPARPNPTRPPSELAMYPNQVPRFGGPATPGTGAPVPANVNLLADPREQQRHRQQMLDRHFLFGPNNTQQMHNHHHQPSHSPSSPGYSPDLSYNANTNNHMPSGVASRGPPYASGGPAGAQSRSFGLQPSQSANQSSGSRPPPPPTSGQNSTTSGPPLPVPLPAPRPGSPATASASKVPACAIAQQSANQSQLGHSLWLMCHEDSEYPTRDIMRALEVYAANEKSGSIEHILPQPLQTAWLQLGQASGQQAMSPLQMDLPQQQHQQPQTIPQSQSQSQQQAASQDYEPMCRSQAFVSQPKRAKNLLGHWKVIVNLPGHKYRNVAVSQLVRVDECKQASASNQECSIRPSNVASSSFLPRSRCLQQFENQRLLAWSHSQGLHLDIFRVPASCSCHIRRP